MPRWAPRFFLVSLFCASCCGSDPLATPRVGNLEVGLDKGSVGGRKSISVLKLIFNINKLVESNVGRRAYVFE